MRIIIVRRKCALIKVLQKRLNKPSDQILDCPFYLRHIWMSVIRIYSLTGSWHRTSRWSYFWCESCALLSLRVNTSESTLDSILNKSMWKRASDYQKRCFIYILLDNYRFNSLLLRLFDSEPNFWSLWSCSKTLSK